VSVHKVGYFSNGLCFFSSKDYELGGTMKKLITVSLLLFGTFFVFAQDIPMEKLPIIQIVNLTGNDIYGVYVCTPDKEELGDNVLEDLQGEILGHGESLDVLLHNTIETINTYDIFMMDGNGLWYVKLEFKIKKDAQIVFTGNDCVYNE
jgi:hypothetical protein